MPVALRAYLAFLAALALERLAELLRSRRNAARLVAQGAVEAGRGHYPAMVIFHAAFLASCAGEAWAFPRPPGIAAWLAVLVALAAQGLRWSAIAALGGRWTTRVLVLPESAPVTAGPYRWLRHPNYLAVVLELAAVPLAYGSWRTALAFSLGNALLLAVRIRAEERALGDRWARAFRDRPRLFPRGASPAGAGAASREIGR